MLRRVMLVRYTSYILHALQIAWRCATPNYLRGGKRKKFQITQRNVTSSYFGALQID